VYSKKLLMGQDQPLSAMNKYWCYSYWNIFCFNVKTPFE
jgi:hypothetical protein